MKLQNTSDFGLSASAAGGFSIGDFESRKDRIRNFSNEIDEVNEE